MKRHTKPSFPYVIMLAVLLLVATVDITTTVFTSAELQTIAVGAETDASPSSEETELSPFPFPETLTQVELSDD